MRAILFVLILIVPALPAGAASFLSGKEIAARAEAGDVAIQADAGYEFPVQMTLRADGTMEGVSGNGYYDVGKWWLRGDVLCHKWASWFDGLRKCFAVSEDGSSLSLAKPTATHFKNGGTRLK